MRLTVGLEPDIAVAEGLVVLQEALADPMRMLGVDPRWAAPERLRLVLDTREVREGDVGHALTALRALAKEAAPTEFTLGGARFYPDERAPRLVAVRASGDGLAGLRAQVCDALRALPDASTLPWEPWVRVGRVRTTPTSHPMTGVITRHADTAFGASRARDLVVWRSDLVNGRARERQLARIPLDAA